MLIVENTRDREFLDENAENVSIVVCLYAFAWWYYETERDSHKIADEDETKMKERRERALKSLGCMR